MAENFGLNVAKLFDVEERINMLNDLPEDVRSKIYDGQFHIRCPRNGYRETDIRSILKYICWKETIPLDS